MDVRSQIYREGESSWTKRKKISQPGSLTWKLAWSYASFWTNFSHHFQCNYQNYDSMIFLMKHSFSSLVLLSGEKKSVKAYDSRISMFRIKIHLFFQFFFLQKFWLRKKEKENSKERENMYIFMTCTYSCKPNLLKIPTKCLWIHVHLCSGEEVSTLTMKSMIFRNQN